TAEVNFACLDIQVEGLFCVDSLLQFTANANLPITTWDWSFGDGGVATAAAPSYSYTDVGTYVVNLSVVFEDGSTAETSLELTISDCPTDPCILPQQLTIVPPNNLCLGTALDFSFDADFEAIAQSWFLDGELVGTAPTYGSFFNTPGTFELKLIAVDAFNCSREATFSIEIENCGICFQAGEQDLTFEGALCLDSTLTFFLPFDPFFYPPAELGWVFNGEFVIDFDPSVTLTQTGEFIVEFFAVDIFGCTYFGALELTVENCDSNDPCDPLPPFSITSSGTFCTNEPLAFGTNTSATIVTYSWTATNGQASTNAIFNPSFDTEGVYEVALTAVDINGCVYSDAQAFDISTCNDPCDPLPIIGINTNAIPSCVGEPLFFTPETTADLVSFNWIASNGATSTTSLFETTFNTAGDQLVELTATDSDGCTYETNIPFFVDECTDPCDPPADLAININGPFCVDSTLLFSASSPATLTSYDWQFSTGAMATSANPTFTPSDSAELTIQLEATDTNGCLLMADTTILIDACAPPPVCDATISIIPPDSLCAGDPLLFAIANNTPLSQQTWTVDGINSFSGPSLSLLVELGELDVELEVIAENGCIYTDQINLNINELCTPPELCRLGIPNAFSPNQDSFNDTFEPVYKCPPLSYELQVYDRWGNQVFVSELPELGWDGTFNGQAMDPGIYVWFVRYQLQDGREVVDKGDVLLMR
ncbi:MAG: PKD domain-containing protein, partial [Bacteroidota bacterium]